MTDKELIKQEIKRRISNLEQIGDRKEIEIHFPEQFKFIKMYEGLLQFIDSLPEEPTVKGIIWEDVNTLESIIYQVHNEYPSIGEKSFGLEVLERFQDCQDDIEEPASKDLEEEITKCYKSRTDLMMTRNQFGELIHRFTEWQKQQMNEALQTEYEKGLFDMQQEMIKDAVDATILDVDAQTIEFGLWPEKLLDIKEGDKVKIIIIKEE